jgi:hypothetical protein
VEQRCRNAFLFGVDEKGVPETQRWLEESKEVLAAKEKGVKEAKQLKWKEETEARIEAWDLKKKKEKEAKELKKKKQMKEAKEAAEANELKRTRERHTFSRWSMKKTERGRRGGGMIQKTPPLKTFVHNSVEFSLQAEYKPGTPRRPFIILARAYAIIQRTRPFNMLQLNRHPRRPSIPRVNSRRHLGSFLNQSGANSRFMMLEYTAF